MNLDHEVRMKFGTSQYEPNQVQLTAICRDVAYEHNQGRTLGDFAAVVKRYCPTAGTYGYKGLDNSDLNTLLALALQEAQRMR